MSAHVVSPEHLNVMLSFGLQHPSFRPSWLERGPDEYEEDGVPWTEWKGRQLDFLTVDQVGEMLVAENVASVRYRYRSSDMAPATILGDGFVFSRVPFQVAPVHALKAVCCYRYQSCEHPGWKGSEASRFCDALERVAVELLPGFSEAPWEWTADDVARRGSVVRWCGKLSSSPTL